MITMARNCRPTRQRIRVWLRLGLVPRIMFHKPASSTTRTASSASDDQKSRAWFPSEWPGLCSEAGSDAHGAPMHGHDAMFGNTSDRCADSQLTHATICVIFYREFRRIWDWRPIRRALIAILGHARGRIGKDVAQHADDTGAGLLVAACSRWRLPHAGAAQGAARARRGAQAPGDATRSRLEATQKRSKELQADLDKIAAERQRINARLVETGKLIHQSEAQLNQIESQLGELEAQEKHLRGTLEAAPRHDLGAACRHAAHGPKSAAGDGHPPRGCSVDGAQRHAAGVRVSRAQGPGRGARRAAQRSRARHDQHPHGGRQAARARRRASTTRARAWPALQETKRQSLAERQAELAQVRQAAAEIAKNVADLSELISKLDKEVAARHRARLLREGMAAEPRAAGVASRRPADAIRRRSRRSCSRRAASRVAMLTPGRIKPAIPFTEAKGLLPLPAQGRRVLDVRRQDPVRQPIQGPRAGDAPRRPGGVAERRLDRLRRRVPQLRPALDHQCRRRLSYSSCWTYLRSTCSSGQFVLAGEPVGVMSDGCEIVATAKTQDNAPILYIEFRKDQTAHRSRPLVVRCLSKGARMTRKSDYAFWTFVMLAVPCRGHDGSQRQPDLFGHLDQLRDLQAARPVRRRAGARAQRLRRQAGRRAC